MVIFLSDTVRSGHVEVISIIDRLRIKKGVMNIECAQNCLSINASETLIVVLLIEIRPKNFAFRLLYFTARLFPSCLCTFGFNNKINV